ncbi:hypothetical protein QS257_06255 [Terrilactibacillus sp. S3-3]|nr:hypothetical protein QS257_06255 [Terrilactibacillus sp. S3-3]
MIYGRNCWNAAIRRREGTERQPFAKRTSANLARKMIVRAKPVIQLPIIPTHTMC